MEIDLVQLREIVNRLLDHAIETRGVKRCELKDNYYWSVPESSLYDVDNKPPQLEVGSLIDDWKFVLSVLDKDKSPVAYQLTEVAPLLQYVGKVLGSEFAKYGG